MPWGLAVRAVVAALHQRDPACRIVADRGDLLLSPGGGRAPSTHAIMIARATKPGPRRDHCGWYPTRTVMAAAPRSATEVNVLVAVGFCNGMFFVTDRLDETRTNGRDDTWVLR